jgi:hypothetical protein
LASANAAAHRGWLNNPVWTDRMSACPYGAFLRGTGSTETMGLVVQDAME